MVKFTAKMVHDESTIVKLSMTQYNTFEYGKKLVRIVIALALIVYGLYADSSMLTPIICLLLGCFLMANVSLRPRVRGKKIAEQLHGNYPRSEYSFTEKSFTFSDKGEEVPYGKLMRLVEDREYMYLYISRESAYMVTKSTVSGTGPEALKKYLSDKTGLKWTKPFSLLTFRFKPFWSGRSKDEYTGERLGWPPR